jgi:hypothetical protein
VSDGEESTIPGFLIMLIVLGVITVMAVVGGILVLFTDDGTDTKGADRRGRPTSTLSSQTKAKSPTPPAPAKAAKPPEVKVTTSGSRGEDGRPSPPSQTPMAQWPPNVTSYYRPCLIAAISASVGVLIGFVSPWTSIMMFTISGLDASPRVSVPGLALGIVSCIGLLAVMIWPRTPFSPRWAVPLAWMAAVIGVAGLSFALPLIVRIMTIPKANLFGVPVGAAVGWGLWLLAVSSVVLAVTACIVATQIVESLEPLGQLTLSMARGWRWAAMIASAVIVVGGITYYSLNWDNNPGGAPSPSQMPSLPNLPSFPSLSPPTTTP